MKDDHCICGEPRPCPHVDEEDLAEIRNKAKQRAKIRRRLYREALESIGMKRVRGNLGGVYYE